MSDYVATKDVRHLAVWTQNTEQTEPWRTGRTRPICGARVPNFNRDSPLPRLTGPWSEHWPVDSRKPICRNCQRVLADLNVAWLDEEEER